MIKGGRTDRRVAQGNGCCLPPLRCPLPRFPFRCLLCIGGMGYSTFVDESPTPNLVGLSDTFFFDILSSTWRVLSPSSPPAFEPSPRYAHISAVTKNRLVVVGGQDLNAAYVQEVGVFDLENEMWIMMQDMGRGRVEERGMYRSSCVAEEKRRGDDGEGEGGKADLYLYSNYNVSRVVSPQCPPPNSRFLLLTLTASPSRLRQFTDVRRVLEVLKPSAPPPSETFSLFDRSGDLRGDSAKSSPQGLRFPSGARLGNWLLFGGIYLANSVSCRSVPLCFRRRYSSFVLRSLGRSRSRSTASGLLI